MCNTHAHEILLGRDHIGDIRQSLTYVTLVKEVLILWKRGKNFGLISTVDF
jgi:hypothetical protein